MIYLARRHNNSPRRRFTLIELLVVIAILGILASILLPSLNRTRDSALSLSCKNNLRQIALGLYMYQDDHDGFYPPAFGHPPSLNQWYRYLDGYIGNTAIPAGGNYTSLPAAKVLWCPSAAGENSSQARHGVGSIAYPSYNVQHHEGGGIQQSWVSPHSWGGSGLRNRGGGRVTVWRPEPEDGTVSHYTNDLVGGNPYIVESVGFRYGSHMVTTDMRWRHGGGFEMNYIDGHLGVRSVDFGSVPEAIRHQRLNDPAQIWARVSDQGAGSGGLPNDWPQDIQRVVDSMP